MNGKFARFMKPIDNSSILFAKFLSVTISGYLSIFGRISGLVNEKFVLLSKRREKRHKNVMIMKDDDEIGKKGTS